MNITKICIVLSRNLCLMFVIAYFNPSVVYIIQNTPTFHKNASNYHNCY